MDIFVGNELSDNLVAVVEIKASDWDRMKPAAVRRNAMRQARQIWSYIDAQIELEGKEVSPGVIFPKHPSDPKRLERIEEIFNDRGIQVVWHDESVEDLKKRKKNEL
ncbi:MAG: hypothetical protein JXB26_14355 [Candidatus Aminicenantes bacterium]|nr:hypothetical protein [Candidatus Aminicenantes bacterium]